MTKSANTSDLKGNLTGQHHLDNGYEARNDRKISDRKLNPHVSAIDFFAIVEPDGAGGKSARVP